MFDGNNRFLDGEPNKSHKIAFCSFPRSGNTFMRRYIEMLTGIATGGDNSLLLATDLQMIGMIGEGIVNDTCWVIKTHSPWMKPYSPPFTANKCIVVVRNPLDSCVSWLQLITMAGHA